MTRRSDNRRLPTPEAADLGFRFLQARRAQNLSWMRLVEQSLHGLADVQRAAGPGGPALARLSSAYARFVRDSAEVYKLATTHLAR